VDNEVILEMDAESMYDVPTSVTGDEGMVGWAAELVKAGQSVCHIGAGCGLYNHLVREDGLEEPAHPRSFASVLAQMLARLDAKELAESTAGAFTSTTVAETAATEMAADEVPARPVAASESQS
jgi:hypothetical protein